MKRKVFVLFENESRRFWSKETGERKGADYILLAQISEQEEMLFASTVESGIGKRYEKNACDDIEGLELLKEKGGEKYLKIRRNGKELRIDKERFLLLFITPDHDQVLYFRFPSLLGGKIYTLHFDLDRDQGNAVAIFWLLKDFF